MPELENDDMIRAGAEHYIAMCQGCHGAPGLESSELARGFEPVPPHLYEKEEAEEIHTGSTVEENHNESEGHRDENHEH